jgi:hypothetical protein
MKILIGFLILISMNVLADSKNPYSPNSRENPYGVSGSPYGDAQNPYSDYNSPYGQRNPDNPYGQGVPDSGISPPASDE